MKKSVVMFPHAHVVIGFLLVRSMFHNLKHIGSFLQDQLNFHKLLDCDCQSPNKIHFCSRQYVLNSVAVPNIEGFDVQNTGGCLFYSDFMFTK